MAGPIVFISRNRVKEGRLDDWRAALAAGAAALRAEKPLTLAFLPYVAENDRDHTIVHVFADAEAFDRHLEGADERSRDAYELIDPVAFELYGRASDQAMAMFRAASAAGRGFRVEPEALPGFLRLGASRPESARVRSPGRPRP
jgi:quinol monooxygenase YgiN